MQRKGDQGADRPDADPGKVTKQNTPIGGELDKETILSQDEKARKFFDDIQRLKADLSLLKTRKVLDIPQTRNVENILGQYVREEKLPAQPARASAKAGGAETGQPQRKPAETAAPAAKPVPAVKTPAAKPEPAAKTPAAKPEPAAKTPVEEPVAGAAPVTKPEVKPEATPAAKPKPAVKTPAAEPAAGAAPVTKSEVRPEATPAAKPEPAVKTPAAKPSEAAAETAEKEPAPVSLESAPQQTAAQTFEKQFRRQMATQMRAVQKEDRRARAKRKQQERELRAEVKRKKRLAAKYARMGGGIVNAHDTTVSTELQPVARFSWRDLLGIVPRSEKRAAASEEELRALKEEQERKTAEARAAASQLRKVRANRYSNSFMGRRANAFKGFCERHKNLLLTSLSLILLVCVGAAGVINYCTAYEYSYNGHVLGYVKSKDQVLQITDMVQRALTEDKEMQVIIDAKDDISFKRISLLDRDVIPDSSEEVLRRLTYMGDLNVKAYGIYVNGEKTGSVRSKDVAAEVLKKIEDRYALKKKGAEIEKAEILENVEVRKSNNSLREVYSADRMADILCTSGLKETVHTVIAGETLNDIALMYGTTEERLLNDNEGVDPRKLEVGSTLLIRQNAPLLTVRMTEKRAYTKTIEYETVKKKTDEMYEDETEVKQEGKDGSESIIERTISINGEIEKRHILSDVVTKKPVKKIVMVGTAERPPTVGDGVYIWPMESGYTLTSRYGYRWGRLHAGIDLGTHVGNDVLAADGGIVVRAGYYGGYGNCVDIDHQNGQMTRYGHLSAILVSVGEGVYEGQHIAEAGNTGRSTGPHLHFEIHNNGQSHDPLQDLP